MQDSNAITAQRNSTARPLLSRTPARAVLITLALIASHGAAFGLGWEGARRVMLNRLDTMVEQWEATVDEAFNLPPTTQPELNLQSDRTAEPDSMATVESTEYFDSEICFEVEPCHNAEAGVDFWDIGADGAGRNPEQAVERGDGCESDTDTPCTDPDTGLLYGYWRGQFFYTSPLNLN